MAIKNLEVKNLFRQHERRRDEKSTCGAISSCQNSWLQGEVHTWFLSKKKSEFLENAIIYTELLIEK